MSVGFTATRAFINTKPLLGPTKSEQRRGVEKGFFYSNWDQVKRDILDVSCLTVLGMFTRMTIRRLESVLGLECTPLNPASLVIGLIAQKAISKFAMNALRYVPHSVLGGLPRVTANIGLRFGSLLAGRDVTHLSLSNLGLSTEGMTSAEELLSLHASYVGIKLITLLMINVIKEKLNETFEKGQITEINEDNFKAEIEEHDGPVILDVYSHGCPPSRALAPIFSELSQEIGTVKFAKFDVTDEPELANKLDIKLIPTLLFYKNGEMVDQNIGLMSKEGLQEKLNKNFINVE